MIERNKTALLLSGPQHYDKQRPVAGKIRRVFEHSDPLGIAIVSTLLEDAGINTHWAEMHPQKMDRLAQLFENAGVVIISSRHFDTSLANQAISIANKMGKSTIVGGYGPTFSPKSFERADTIVSGEFEPVAERVIGDLLRGKLEPHYDARQLPPHDITNNYIMPNRNIFPKWKGPLSKIYKHSQEWQRGCSNCCTFCSPTRMQKNVVENGQRKVRVRDINNIKDEIENGMRLKPGDHLFSVDLNTSAIPKKDQRELFSYLKKKGIRWYTEGTTSPLLEDYKKNGPEASLLSLMSARETLGGCYSFLYGVDDLISNKVAGSRDKDIQTLMESVKIFREMGVPINLSVVMGLDNHHYPDSFFQAAEMLQEVEAPYTFLHIATPYPGTTWGQKAYDEGKVFGTESTHFNHRKVVASPKNMTADELQQGYYWLMRTLSNPKQLAQTAKTNLKPGEFVKNPTLGVIQSGLPFGLETHLTTLELKARGYIDASIQNELDRGYKNWKSRSLSLSPQL